MKKETTDFIQKKMKEFEEKVKSRWFRGISSNEYVLRSEARVFLWSVLKELKGKGKCK